MCCDWQGMLLWRGPWLAALALALALPTAGWAQDDDDLGGIDTIIVTITKREESLQEVAATIAAFGAETIENANIESVGDLIGLLPNVQVKGERSDLTIRGVSRAAFDSQSPVAQHVNGVYKFRSESYLGQFYDLESVQVALGPSGTLYGRNATAGAMDIRWKRPHDEYEVFGDATYGAPYGNWQFRGGVNIPLLGAGNDTLMLRLVGVRETQDALIENQLGTKRTGFGARDDLALRGTLLWNPTEDLSIEMRGKFVTNNQAYAGGPLGDRSTVPVGSLPLGPLGTVTFDWASGFQQFGADLAQAFGLPPIPAIGIGIATCGGTFTAGPGCLAGAPLIRDPQFLNPALPIPQSDQKVNTRTTSLGSGFVRIWGYDATIEYAMHDLPFLGDVTLTALGGFEHLANEGISDADGTELEALDTVSSQLPDKWYTAEVRLDSQNDGWFNWTLGAFYLVENVFQNRATLTPLTISGATKHQTDEGYAFFGNVRVNPIDDVELTAGVRWNHDSTDNRENAFATPLTPETLFEGSEVFRETTIDLGSKWFINEDHMVYLKWSRGYKAGFVQLLPNPLTGGAIVNAVKPEQILATEAGWKSTWLDGRLNLQTSAFHYKYTNQQVPVILATSIPNLNAEQTTIWGVEVVADWNITESWFARGALGYLNAEFDAFCSVDPLAPNPFAANFDPACEKFRGQQTLQTKDVSGNTPEDSPEWKFSLLTSYEWDLGERGTIKPTLEFTWTDKSFTRPFNTKIDEVDSYTKTDLRIRWESVDARYFVELFGENLEDEIVYPRLIVVALTGTAQNFGLLQPRTYGVRIGFHWTGNQ